MRTALFALCFTLGVSLMILSGYLPKSASAQGSPNRASVSDPEKTTPVSERQVIDSAATARLKRGLVTYPARGADEHTADVVQSAGQTGPDAVSGAVTDSGVISPPESGSRREPVGPPKPLWQTENTKTVQSDSPEALNDAGMNGEGGRPAGPPTVTSASSSNPAADNAALPAVSAGADRIVWIGWDEIALSGNVSGADRASCSWKQVGGPVTLKIDNAKAAKTVARGFPLGAEMSWSSALYKFELTVTDARGGEASDTVEYVVLAAPDLSITPKARRQFALRDGYWMAHYEAWATATDGDRAVLRVTAPTEVTFTRISGGSYEVAAHEAGRKYTYEITLYAQPGEATGWIEFLIDTADKVPGIIQFGANWDARP